MTLLLLSLHLASPARASEEDHHEEHASWHVDLRGIYSIEHHHRETTHLGGFGAGIARTLVPEWLEVELAAAMIFGADGVRHVPVELVFLKPFEAGPVEVALGLGPLVEFGFHHQENHVAFGASLDAAVLCWFTPRLGLKLGAMLELKSEEGEFVQELATSLGPVFGW